MSKKDKLNEMLQNVMRLFSARNKLLWEGEAGKGETLTVPGLSNYSLVEVWTRLGQFLFNPQHGHINGIHSDQLKTSDTSLIHHVYGVVNGDQLTIRLCQYYAPGDASSLGETAITRIIGVEPIMKKPWGAVAPKREIGGCPMLVRRCLA